MNDSFIILVNNKTIFNSKWLDSDSSSYIKTQGKIIRIIERAFGSIEKLIILLDLIHFF